MIEAGDGPDERTGNGLGPVMVDLATGRGDRCRVVAGRHPLGVVVGFHAFAVQDPGRGNRGASPLFFHQPCLDFICWSHSGPMA